jgi:drug/metabolite transporter (DMT)-like permease
MKNNRSLVLLAFAAIYLIWGSTYLAIQVGIETLPPFLMAGVRFLLAGVPFYFWLRSRGVPSPSKDHWMSAMLLGGLMMFGGNGLVTWSEQFVPSSVAAVLIATVPLWMTLLDRFFYRGAPLGFARLAGVLVGFTGVVILVAPSASQLDRVDPLGAGALILAALLWGIGSLHSRRMKVPDSPFMAAAMQMIGGGAVLVVVGSAGGEWGRLDISQVSLASVLAMLYLVVFGSIIALSAYVFLLRVTAASAVSTYAFVNPVVAVLLGWTFAGERLGPRTLVASALVISAVVLILVPWKRAPKVPRQSSSGSGRSASTRVSAVTGPLRISDSSTSLRSRTR